MRGEIEKGGSMSISQRYKMLIAVDVETGAIESVQKVIDSVPQIGEIIKLGDQKEEPSNPEGGYRHVGTLLSFSGSRCVTLNLPGGGSYKICQ
jgi:hypothetical protein